MSTDLYMGGIEGPEGSSDMNKILGIKQMIVGAIESDKEADLVLSEESANKGSAWLAGNFTAVNELFKLESEGENDATMVFGTEEYDVINATTTGLGQVDFLGEQISFVGGEEGNGEATFKTKLTVDYDTEVAAAEGATFKAGNAGKYILAEGEQLNLMNGSVVVEKNGGETQTTVDTKLDVTGKTNLQAQTTIGAKDGGTLPQFINKDDLMLNVQGSAFVSKDFEAKTIKSEEVDVLTLKAGGSPGIENNRWLNVNANGVTIADINAPEKKRLIIDDQGNTQLYSASGLSALDLGATDAILEGADTVKIHTEDATEGAVKLQDKAIILRGKNMGMAETDTNEIDLNARFVDVNANDTMKVKTDKFVVTSVTNPNEYDFIIDTGSSKAELTVDDVLIDTRTYDGTNGQLYITGNGLLEVATDSGGIRNTEETGS